MEKQKGTYLKALPLNKCRNWYRMACRM